MGAILTRDQFDQVYEDAVLNGFAEARMQAAYSGRGMYGKTCLGYVGDQPIKFQIALAKVLFGGEDEMDVEDLEYALDDLGEPVTDSMGRSTIYYYPGISVEDADALQAELDEEG